MTEENMAAPTTTGCHQACLTSMPIPPAAKPTAARMQAMLPSNRVVSFPSSLANAQEPSGQDMLD